MEIKHIAPLQLIVIGFEKPVFMGRIMDELNNLRQQNLIRLIDAMAVQKSDEGEISGIEISDLPHGNAVQDGNLIGYLLGLRASEESATEESVLGAAMNVDSEYEYGLDPAELETITEDIVDGGAAIIMLIEHLWALPLKQATRAADGVLIAQDFLSPETLIGVEQKTFLAVAH